MPKSVTPWVATAHLETVHLMWQLSPFEDNDAVPTCVAFGDEDFVRVEGIIRQTLSSVDVMVENRDKTRARRGTVMCTGVK